MDERYDIVIIISVKSVEPISINLITTFLKKEVKGSENDNKSK